MGVAGPLRVGCSWPQNMSGHWECVAPWNYHKCRRRLGCNARMCTNASVPAAHRTLK